MHYTHKNIGIKTTFQPKAWIFSLELWAKEGAKVGAVEMRVGPGKSYNCVFCKDLKVNS